MLWFNCRSSETWKMKAFGEIDAIAAESSPGVLSPLAIKTFYISLSHESGA
jgi:hypothetical protein